MNWKLVSMRCTEYCYCDCRKKEIQSDTLKAIQQISTFLSILAEKYKQEKAGELELE